MFSCQIAATESAKESVYQLRYRVYVQEMGQTTEYADHQRHIIVDPRDRDGVLFGSYDGDRLIGTALGTPASCDQLGEYVSLYQLDRMSEQERKQTFLFSMLIFEPSYRGSHAVIQCVRSVILHFFEQGFRRCMLHCYPRGAFSKDPNVKTTNYFVNMSQYCQRYGFEEVGYGQTHNFDSVLIMQCDLGDPERLAACRSPLLPVLYPRETHESNEPNPSALY